MSLHLGPLSGLEVGEENWEDEELISRGSLVEYPFG